MRPKERRPSGQKDMFQSQLSQIINQAHALVKLAQKIERAFLKSKLGVAYTDRCGRHRCQFARWLD